MEIQNDKIINFAILGCGMIASVHADAISKIPNAKLVAVCDNDFERAKAFASEKNITAYNNLKEMISCEEIDSVCVCTPSCFHKDNTIELLNYDKHVVVEKPMAFTASEADEIILACKKSNKLVTVISQLRYSSDVNKVKSLVESGAFGTISLVELSMKYYRSPEYYSSSPWKGKLKFDGGGALMNQGVHGVDLLQYVLGGVKKVVGATKTLIHDIEVEDTAVAIVEFTNGALGTIVASSCAYPGFERTIKIQGSNGYVILTENKISKIMLNGVESSETEAIKSISASDASKLDGDYHKIQLTNFINAVNGKEPLLIDASEGKKAIEIIEKIYKTNAF